MMRILSCIRTNGKYVYIIIYSDQDSIEALEAKE